MDLLAHLTDEHRTAERLLAQLAESEPGETRERLVAELDDALTVHMAVEERFLYPIVAEVLGPDDVTEAENEHALARDGLTQLHELADEGGFQAAVEMVTAGIAHHVEDEEGKLFPELRARAVERVAGLEPDELEAEVRQQGTTGRTSDGPTKAELYERARAADIRGRSSMSKAELADALDGT